jgi:PAS domain S-box-containing protein
MKTETYWQLIDQIAAPVIILDAEGLVREINSLCLDLLGSSKDQFLGRHFEMLVVENHRDRIERFLQESKEGESKVEIRLDLDDASDLRVKLTGNPARDSLDFPNYIIITIDPNIDNNQVSENIKYHDYDDMKWLADQGRHLLTLDHGSEILDFASRALHEKLGKAIIIALTKLDEDNLQLKSISGIDKNILTKVWNLIGGDFYGRLFPIDDRFRETYSKRRLYLHPGGLEEFAISQVPERVSKHLSQMVGIDKIYTIGLEGNRDVMGCFYIFSLDSDLILSNELVESFSFQVALALEKSRIANDLKASQEKFLTIYEYAPDAYYLSDLQGNFLDGNIAAEKITGFSKAELIGSNFLKSGLLSKDQIIKAGKLLAQNLLGKSTGPDEFALNQKDGTTIPVEILTYPVTIDEKTVVLGIARDVSARKKAQDELSQAQGTLTKVLEGIDAHVYVADMDTYEILYMNKRMIQDYGGNFIGDKCYKIFRGENRTCEDCSNSKLVDQQGSPGEVYVWEGLNSKTQKWYRNYDRAVFWTDQRLVRMQIAVDITDSKENQLALTQSEERYRNLFEKSHNAIMTVTPPDWRFTSGNLAMLKMFRLKDRDQLLGLQPWELSPEFQPDGKRSKDKAGEMLQVAVENGSNFFDWTHKRWDGEDFPATVQLTRVDLEEGFFIQATVRDISERVRDEKQLMQQMDDLAIINDLTAAANQGKSLEDIFQMFSQTLIEVFGFSHSHIFLLENENTINVNYLMPGNDFQKTIEKTFGIKVPDQITIEMGHVSVYRDLLLQKKPQVFRDPQLLKGMMQEMLDALIPSVPTQQGVNNKVQQILKQGSSLSVAVFPMLIEDDVIGFVDIVFPYSIPESVLKRITPIAEQLSGIIQRRNAEIDRNLSISELEFVNQTIVDGSRIENIDEICEHLARSVKRINPDLYLVVSLYDPDQEAIRVRAVEGIGKFGEKLFKKLGGRPEEFQVETNRYSLDEDLNNKYTSGKLERIPGGLFDLTRGKLPEKLCRSIERMTGVTDVYIAGFGLEGKSTGGLVFFLTKDNEIKFPEAIEAVVSHYSVIFERRMAQNEVLKRKTQLEALREIELELAKELNIGSLLHSIAEKTRTIVNASACGFSVYNPDRHVLEYKAYSGFEELPEDTDLIPGEGLSGLVYMEKATITVENYSTWENRLEDWVPVGNYYLAGIPVSWGEEILGVLEVALDPGKSLSSSELSTLELFAAQAAIAIKNAQLFSDEKSRRIEAETLREVGLLINQLVDQPDMLDRVLVSMQKIIPYTSASIQLVEGQDVVIEAYKGIAPKPSVIGVRYPINENFAAKKIINEGKSIILNNRSEVIEMLENPGRDNIVSWLAVPLQSKGNRIGILTLDHDLPDQYSDQDVQLALAFSSQVVVALENNRLLNETRRRTREIQAVYDSALSLTKELQPEILFEDLYKQIEPLFNPDAYILAIHDPTMDIIRVAYATEGGLRQRQAENWLISPEEDNSLLGWIVRKRAPLLIGNVETDSIPIQPQQEGKTIRSFLGVPLLIADRVCGALVVQTYQANTYTHDHQRLLQLLGNQVAIALENSRLFEDARRRLSRLASLHDIDQAISGSVDLRTTMDVLINHLIHTLGVDAACVLSYDRNNKTLDYVEAKGFRTPSLQHTSLKIGDGLAGKAALERNLIHIIDLNEQVTSLQQSPQFSQEEFVTYLAQPLIAKGELVGVLEVFNREKLMPDPEWFRFLDSLSRSAAIAIDRLNLLNSLRQSNIDLKQAYDATIEGWARAIELRDGDTEGHSRRVVALTMNLARKMGISGEELTHMRRGALLHDIGKMAIPDGILLKSGKLSDEEWLIMKKHPQFAYDMLSQIEYLMPALDIPYAHHERWDGSGYPKGLAGDDIPLAARIFAVVDVWDALQSDRPYREAWSEEKAIQYLKDQSGKEFDPGVVNEFLELIKKV